MLCCGGHSIILSNCLRLKAKYNLNQNKYTNLSVEHGRNGCLTSGRAKMNKTRLYGLLLRFKLSLVAVTLLINGIFIFFQALSQGSVGFPKIHHFGTCGGKYNALVMDLLGPNLEEVFNSLGRKFTLKTVLLVAIQLLDRIEHIHQ